jgi:uroporphyrinogen decarboxylase
MVDIMQQCVIVDPAVPKELGCNTNAKVIYFLPATWREGEAYDGGPIMVPEKFRPVKLPDGTKVIIDAEGNHEIKLPKDGFFYDVTHHPLQHIEKAAEMDRYADIIDNFDRPSWSDNPLEKTAGYVRDLRDKEDKFLVGSFQGHIFQAGQILRGWDTFMLDLAVNPSFAEALMDRLTEGHMKAFEKYAQTVGKYVDVIEVADDLGIQESPWMSPEMYRKHIKPYHARLYDFIRKNCDARLLFHSDGSIYPIIPDLIEMGVDILNPLQYTAKDMELVKVKKEFGKDLCFWGGGIDTQTILPFGTPQQVADEVKRNIDTMAPGGGFVIATVHKIIEWVSA